MPQTPFDDTIAEIAKEGYHNHRKESHSDAVSRGVLRDLRVTCASLREDLEAGVVRAWLNVQAPGGRKRKVDLFIGEAIPGTEKPDIATVRFALENKSVITAHRNRSSRYDDLGKNLETTYKARQKAVIAATVLIGVAERVLNIPDKVVSACEYLQLDFDKDVRPRLSTGDQSLWEQFAGAISHNTLNDMKRTIEELRKLPTRNPGHSHESGYDALLLVPVNVDNVNPPSLPRPNVLGIDVDAEYQAALKQLCTAYHTRYHL